MPQSALITKATSELCSNWIRFYDSPYDISDSSTLCDLQFISVDQRNELSVSLDDGSVWSLPNFQSPTTQIPLQQLTSNVATQDDSYIWLLVVCTWCLTGTFTEVDKGKMFDWSWRWRWGMCDSLRASSLTADSCCQEFPNEQPASDKDSGSDWYKQSDLNSAPPQTLSSYLITA